MNDNGQNRLILKVELTPDNKIEYECMSKHVPTLAYIKELIGADVIEQITLQKLKAEMKDAPIVKPANGNELRGFLNRYRKKR